MMIPETRHNGMGKGKEMEAGPVLLPQDSSQAQ